MSVFFLKIVNMSISASWIVLAVLLLRLILKKAPKWTTILLWGIVAIRLVFPCSIESVLSLIPSAETIRPEIVMDGAPEINTGIPVINNAINPVISGSFSPEPAASANPLQIWIPIVSIAWLVGIAVLLAYTVISYWRVYRKVGTAVLLRDNIYQSETVSSPFVLGIIKTRIYLPFHMNEQDMEHVIAHEQAHIYRKDHLWKLFGFLLLTLHWFNPLMWLGYILLCRDIELACDEKVVKEMNTEQRAYYSQALLTCSVNRRRIAACPLAFGEVGVKSRVKSVLNYKKPAFWIIVAAIVVSVIAAVCFLTNPAREAEVFTITDGYTTHDKVDIVATELMVGEKTGHIVVKWDNQTNKAISYGEEFHVYRKVSGRKHECKNDNNGWNNKLYEMRGTDGERTISLNGIKIKAKGEYVLEFNFEVAGDEKEYTAYIEFKGEEEDDNIQNITVSSERITWTYSPVNSSTFYHFFCFDFDLDYTHIEATCNNGRIWSPDTEGQPYDTSMRYCWTPSESAITKKIPNKSEISFNIYDGEQQIYCGILVLECVEHGTSSARFEVYLEGNDDLLLTASENGALIINLK